jgi:hypothetical protein
MAITSSGLSMYSWLFGEKIAWIQITLSIQDEYSLAVADTGGRENNYPRPSL